MSVKYFSILNYVPLKDIVIKFVIGESVTNFVWPIDFVFTEVYQYGTFHIVFRYTDNDMEAPYRIIFQNDTVQLFHEKGKLIDNYFEERMNFRGTYEWKWDLYTALNIHATSTHGNIIDSVVMMFQYSDTGLWIERTTDEELRGLYLA